MPNAIGVALLSTAVFVVAIGTVLYELFSSENTPNEPHSTQNERRYSRYDTHPRASTNSVNPSLMNCTICQDTEFGGFCRGECGHCFHKKCILKWLEQNSLCPICRDGFKSKSL